MDKLELKFQKDISQLFESISTLIGEARQRVAVSANAEATILNYKVGVFVNAFILEGNRAPYGKQIIGNLSLMLTQKFGSGWSSKHLFHCLRTAESFSEEQIVSAVQRQLSWTHLKTVAYEKDELKRTFYLEMAKQQRWNTRTLSEQIDKMLFERTAIAAKPPEQIEQALKELNQEEIINPDLIFKSSYVLDFLGLRNTYSEKDVETALISNLQQFIMELGNGFAFLERQKRISVDSLDYHLDLLFYHRKLKSLVAIDLKLGKFKPEYKAQMELYLRWLQKNEMQAGEESPIGLLLCSEGNTEHVELLMLDNNQIKVAQYLTELPDKQWFADKLHRSLEIAKMNLNE
ncbi:YhcG family protein [Aquiflexum sp.]|uniref:PDDEXK nuclease domain-containing protein n=1 Tax=Aquiflexum sp. TaxID=1872584 RepID=UPI0035939482